MATNFNFAPQQATVVDGYTIDFGEAYSPEKGYGWVQESDLSTPIDLTPNTRDRASDALGNRAIEALGNTTDPFNYFGYPLIDTFIHMQYPEDNPNHSAVKTPAAWQYDILDGKYLVTASVGDAVYEDSVHTINVEGTSLINDFVPDEFNLSNQSTAIITVKDGQLTVDAIGGENTKLNFIDITPLSGTLINFGLSDSSAPDEAIKDFGEAYSEEMGYGWVQESDLATPLDVTLNARDRGSDALGDLQDSLIHMQYPENGVTDAERTPAAWQYNLPNGEYQVAVSVGDAAYLDSTHVINVEGVPLIDEFVPSEENLFTESYGIVEVTDGNLTIDAVSGENTKLNYVGITPVIDVKVNFCSPKAVIAIFPPVDPGYPEGYELDFGDAYSDNQGYGWITEDSVGEDNPTPVDITGNARERDLVDNDVLDTFIHMQYPDEIDNETANKTPAAWEYALPNGFYDVTVSVGDAAYTDSVHSINVEGIEVISDFIPSTEELFTTGSIVGVEVTDGKLTIDAIGGENTKLNFVEISSTSSMPTPLG